MKKERFYPGEIEKIGEDGVQMIRSGAVRNHKLANNARTHSGELEENEALLFCDFLSTKNCEIIEELI